MALALAVLPYLDHGLATEALDSMTDPRITVMPWDNSRENLGVTRPWALAAALVLDGAADWLILWSTAIVLGPDGGALLADALEAPEPNPHVPTIPRMVSGSGCGWHLHAIHRSMLERVGNFDDAAFHAYYEDSDWLYRHHLAGLGDCYVEGNVQIDVYPRRNRGDGHSILLDLVQPDLVAGRSAYLAKWGGDPQSEAYCQPYDDPSLDWRYVGPPPRPVALA